MGTTKLILSDAARARITRREEFAAHQRKLLRDEIRRKTSTVAPDGIFDVTNAEQQLGRMLSSKEVKDRLNRMNRSLQFFVTPDRTKIGIYHTTPQINPVTGKAPWRKFVCGMENGMNPEFSVINKETSKIPDPDTPGNWLDTDCIETETRGWRTVLLRMLREGLITEPQIQQHFGVSVGRSSKKWFEAMNA